MLSIEEIKSKLNSTAEDSTDKASVFDEILTDISDTYSRLSELEKAKVEVDSKLTELSDKTHELTQTNLKLLDKIKYVAPDTKVVSDEDDKPEVEIADLTTWYEEEK